MPLAEGSSRTVVGKNIAEMERAGHPADQSIAASLKKAGLSKNEESSSPPSSTPRYRIRGLQVFAAGTYRGKPYTTRDLDDMVRNFREFSTGPRPLHRVPGAFGHTEADLRRSDIPATGWTKALYRDGDTLKVDQEDIAEPEALPLLQKRYGTVSAEIYDNPQLAGINRGTGKMLRRVCFLGGDVPEVKGLSLAEGPTLERYREQARAGGFASAPSVLLKSAHARETSPGVWACFSEVRDMPLDSAVSAETAETSPPDRENLLESLGSKHGVDTSKFDDAVPDHALQEVHRALDAKDAKMAEDMEGDVPAVDAGDTGRMQEYREKVKKFMERAAAYTGRARAYAEKCGMRMEEGGERVEKKEEKKADEYSEDRLRNLIRQELTAGTAELRKFHEETVASEAGKAVDAIVEDLVRTGRVPRAEAEGEKRELLLLDRGTVHTFAEGGKTVKETLFDARVRRLRGRSSHFAELIGDPKSGNGANGTADGADDIETQKVGQHFDQFREFYPKTETREGLISGFKAAQKANPRITAEKFRGE